MKNLDAQETQHFAKMANRWWDLEGPCRPLHDLNPVRLQFINDRVVLKDKKILDIGCGAGILSEGLAKRGAIVTGIDASAELIEAAKDHALESNIPSTAITYVHSTVEHFLDTHPEYLKHFDIITCLELLEHVPDPELLIKTAAQLVCPEGDLFFSTINRNIKSYLMAVIGAEYLLKLLPKNTHHYEKFIRPSELDQALRQADLKLIDIAGLNYNPWTRHARLTQDVSVNYIAQAKNQFILFR